MAHGRPTVALDQKRGIVRQAVLQCDGATVAPLLVAETVRERGRGLLGRGGIDGAMLLRPCRSVHTFGMRFAIDVAFCDPDLVVLRTVTLARNRPGAMAWRAASVLEAETGSFVRWGLAAGRRLAIGTERGPG